MNTLPMPKSNGEEVAEGGGDSLRRDDRVGEGFTYTPHKGKTDARGGVLLVLLHEGDELRLVLAVADRATVVAEHDLLQLAEDGAERGGVMRIFDNLTIYNLTINRQDACVLGLHYGAAWRPHLL